MIVRPASPGEVASVASALEDFRTHWASFPILWPCPFVGSAEDLSALDYLECEGLGYPASGIAGAALVWGNVLARSAGFHWHFDEALCGLVLCPPGEDRLVSWPFGRVYEVQCASWPAMKYQWITAEVIAQALGRRGMSERDADRAVGLIRDGEMSAYSELLEIASKRFRE